MQCQIERYLLDFFLYSVFVRFFLDLDLGKCLKHFEDATDLMRGLLCSSDVV
jgi:hypothetical protein